MDELGVLDLNEIVVVHVSRHWVKLLHKSGVVWKIILGELNEIIIVNISGGWVKLLDEGGVVWEVISGQLNELLILSLDKIVIVNVS